MMTPPGHRSGQTPPVGHPLRFTVIAHGNRRCSDQSRASGSMGWSRGRRLSAPTTCSSSAAARAICSRGCCPARRRPRPRVSTGTRGSWPRLARRPSRRCRRSGVVHRDRCARSARGRPVGGDGRRDGRERDPRLSRGDAGRPRAGGPAGGVVLFGDGVWVREPLSSGLASFGMTRDQLSDGPDGFAGLGWRLVSKCSTSRSSTRPSGTRPGLVRRRDRALGGGEHVRPGSRGLPGTRATLPVVVRRVAAGGVRLRGRAVPGAGLVSSPTVEDFLQCRC